MSSSPLCCTHLYGVLTSMLYSPLCCTHLYGVLTSMSSSPLCCTHLYGVLTSMLYSPLWCTHLYMLYSPLWCTHLYMLYSPLWCSPSHPLGSRRLTGSPHGVQFGTVRWTSSSSASDSRIRACRTCPSETWTSIISYESLFYKVICYFMTCVGDGTYK